VAAEVEFIPQLLKPARFARLIDASRSKVYELIQSGEVRSVKVGGGLRIPATELHRFESKATTEKID